MSVCAIICEYNPFHNGHKYQIQQARLLSGCDHILCLMSGSLVQRAELAIADKYSRAKAALENGADIVIELPAIYATADAECFALGAVKTLDELGYVTHLCFGAESANEETLAQAVDILSSREFAENLRQNLAKGHSYPTAIAKCMQIATQSAEFHSTLCDIVLKPNNILALEYCKALRLCASQIQPVAVKRIGDYLDDRLTSPYASASAIRTAVESDIDSDIIGEFVPQETLQALSGQLPNKGLYSAIVTAYLKNTDTASLADIYSVSEGLEFRIKQAADRLHSLDEIIAAAKTKRYTHSRLRRIALQNYLGVTKSAMQSALDGQQLIYALGARKGATHLLRNAITRNAELSQPLPQSRSTILDISHRADNLFEIAASLDFDLLYQKGIIILS